MIMSVTSYFFPKEALQGEDLPSHITWKDFKFDKIQIIHPKTVSLKEIYNVDDKDVVIKEGIIEISKVQVNGYLGVVYETEILPEKAHKDKIEYFFLSEGKSIQNLKTDFYLFRPDVVVKSIPQEIQVNPETGEVKPKILVRNFGEGTAYIDIETKPESEIKKSRPKFVDDFLEDFKRGVKSSILILKKNFSVYETLLIKVEKFLTNPVKFSKKPLDEFKKFEKEMNSAMEENEEFARAFAETLAEVFLRSREFVNVYQFILDYINSIGKEKMLVRDPFNVIKVGKKPRIISMNVKYVDMLRQVCEPIPVADIKIVGTKDSEIPLFKLFQWGEQ
jgi:hypothetical protein